MKDMPLTTGERYTVAGIGRLLWDPHVTAAISEFEAKTGLSAFGVSSATFTQTSDTLTLEVGKAITALITLRRHKNGWIGFTIHAGTEMWGYAFSETGDAINLN